MGRRRSRPTSTANTRCRNRVRRRRENTRRSRRTPGVSRGVTMRRGRHPPANAGGSPLVGLPAEHAEALEEFDAFRTEHAVFDNERAPALSGQFLSWEMQFAESRARGILDRGAKDA